MTNPPGPGNSPNPDRRDRRWVRSLKRIGIPLVGVTVAGVAGGTWWGWNFIHRELSPLVEKNLSQSLNRPVQLGGVERFTLSSIRFGPSSLPPTPTDPDHLSIQAVDVVFNPLRLIFSRDLNLDITAIRPEIYLEQGKDGTWVETQIEPEEQPGPIRTDLRIIRFQDARAVLVPRSKTGEKGIPVMLSQLNGQAELFDNNQRFTYKVAGKSDTGGSLDLQGETRRLKKTEPVGSKGTSAGDLPLQTNLEIRGQNFLVSEIDRLVNIPNLTLSSGRVNGRIAIQLRPDETLPDLRGTAQFEGVTLQAQGVPRPFTRATGALQLQGKQIRLDNTNAFYGKVPALVKGTVHLEQGFNMAARVKSATLPDVLETLQVSLPFSTAGAISADLRLTGPLQQPVLSGIARSIKPGQFDRVALSQYTTEFRLDTADRRVIISTVQATPTAGGQVTGSGEINLTEPARIALNFQALGVPGDALARPYNDGNPLPVRVGPINAQTQLTGPVDALQILTRWQALEGDYPARGEILIADGVTTLRNTVLQVAGGTATVQGRSVGDRWQATVVGSGIQLRRFSADLRGLFSGEMQLTGSVASFRPADVRGQGQVRFSEGISVVGQPLDAQIQWDGQKVVVQQATAPGFSANGAVFARLEGQGAPEITGLDLTVQTTDYSLQALSLPLPGGVDYSGRVDFNGRVTGTPVNPTVSGGVALKQFVLNGYAFEPLMQGNLRVANGVSLNVAGVRDRLSATLGSDYQLLAFTIQREKAVAKGRTQGGLLLVEATDFPVGMLASPGMATLFPFSGDLSGNLAVDLRKLSAAGQVAIVNPTFGTYRADRFDGRIHIVDGAATLSGAKLRRDGTTFQIDGTAVLQGDDPTIKGQVRIAQGNLQDVLKLLQIFDLQDLARGIQPPVFGTGDDLNTVPVELAEASIQTQLRRLSEVKTLLQLTTEQRAEAPIPELRELVGSLDGELNVSGSLRAGLNANFNLRGQAWKWGPYSAKEVVAVGSFENGVLTLLPLRFQSDQSFVSFSGQLGGQEPSGQFRMENISVESLQPLVNTPLPIEGTLNATATLAGTWNNPQAIGEISLTNGSLNGTAVREGRGNFQYANARLNFGSRIVIAEPEPISIVGSLPFPLPYAGAVTPDSNQISLDINVKNEGLAVLNALNNQVEWVDGQGSVVLKVRGTLEQPDAQGTIQLAGATLKARALPEPITDVNGTIAFNRDRLNITEAIVGRFSKGQITAAGTLPLATPFLPEDPDAGKVVAVKLENIRLNLKGLYQGAVDGSVDIMGTALNPVLGGAIQLSNGQVLLAEQAENASETEKRDFETASASNIEFNNLKLELGRNLRITSAPILNFVASGELTINGSLSEIRPSGVINLTAGQVNLFTTQFTLARGYPQTAEFLPQQGLNPNLDIRLIALVPEVVGSRLPTSTLSNEVIDAPRFQRYGSVQSVRVQARVIGPASELDQNLELTSSPARTESEIVSLIGGGFVSTLGQGNGALGLANIAGSALLTNVQGFIGNALGLSDFRLFPTITPTQDSRDSRRESNLDLAMEAGIDITRALSFSVLKILTSDAPAQFNLRYRLNNEILLRTSTDFSGDSRAIIEYETRF
jgi:translocation and assembly module TamB